MEALCDLLFELSNEDRLRILNQLQTGAMKLSHISKKLDFTVQETSRNIARLTEAKLARRTSEGSYEITPYGEQALRLIPGFEFISRNADYFCTHTLSGLPNEFTRNIGDLSLCTFTNDVLETFNHAQRVMQEAEEYLYFAVEQVLLQAIPVVTEAAQRGVIQRTILPSDVVLPQDPDRLLSEPEYVKFVVNGAIQTRYLDKLDFCLAMSEKEIAGVSFVNLDGRLDHLDFRGDDPVSVKWCKRLFEHYWERSLKNPINI